MSPTPTTRSRAARLLAGLLAAALAVGTLAVSDLRDPDAAHANGSFGTLSTGDGPVDVAIAGGFAYTANRLAGTVSVFSTADWSSVTTLTVGENPYHVSPTNDRSQVWVSNTGSGTISVIDTSSNTVVDTISVGGAPRAVIFTADDSIGYVLNSTLNTVQAVTTATMAVTGAGSAFTPSDGLLSADENSLFFTGVGGMDRIVRVDLLTGTFDYNETVALPDGGRAEELRWSPDGTEMWATVHAESSQYVAVLNSTATQVLATIPVDGLPQGFTFSADGDLVYVTEYTSDRVAVIDASTRQVLSRIDVGNEPYSVASDASGTVAVTNFFDDTLEVLGLERERLAGSNRYATAVEVSKRGFPTGASTVFIASGATFPDALAAGPAAGTLGASLLLTPPTALASVVRDEIIRLNPDTIYLVGGTGAVSTAVENALKVLQPNTIRLAGANRYATGAAIVEEVWGGTTVPEVFIATGRNYPDALSAGAVAAAEGVPVVLVDGSRSTVPQATIDLIADLDPAQITIAGGISAVSAGIASQLDAAFTAEVRRLAGANRYETSAAINLDAYPTNAGVIYATGTGFADALAGAAFAGRAQIPVYLVQPGCVPEAAIDAIWSGTTTNLFLLGGPGALSTAVESLTGCP